MFRVSITDWAASGACPCGGVHVLGIGCTYLNTSTSIWGIVVPIITVTDTITIHQHLIGSRITWRTIILGWTGTSRTTGITIQHMHHDFSYSPCISIIRHCYLQVYVTSGVIKPKFNNVNVVIIIPSTKILSNNPLHSIIICMLSNWILCEDDRLSALPFVNEEKCSSKVNSIVRLTKGCMTTSIS